MQLDFGYLSMTELRSRPGELLDRVATKGEAFIIERNGRREACLVPMAYFFPDIAPKRIAEELASLEANGEFPRTTISDAREMVFRFPNNSPHGDQSEIQVVLPHGYPNACPRVYANGVRDGAPHRWADGALCLYGVMSSWNPGKHTVLSTLQLTRRWLGRYDSWLKNRRWPEEEVKSHEL
jgi:prevent-host-death family protein